MNRQVLERWQVLVYALAIALGAVVGLKAPAVGTALSAGIWPLLGVLLLVTFLQVPLSGLGAALRHRRYLAALLVGNFVLVPLVVFGLARLLPDEPSLRLGFFLVMLVPCTDWFTTFAHLGRGDGRLALASTPLLLLLQMALLPLLLWALLGPEAVVGMRARPFLLAFAGIIILPLLVALGLERGARGRPRLASALAGTAWLPVPLLGLVLFTITAGEIGGVLGAAAGLVRVVAVFVGYLALVPLLAMGVNRAFGVGGSAARTVVFSLGTRNSFVVLPLVLAWPGAGPLAASVVVVQSLVELSGMLIYLLVVPRLART